MGLSSKIEDINTRRAVQNLELRLNKVQSPAYAGLTLGDLSGVLKATAGVVSGNATHNILTSLQGGKTDEYYHLTETQHSAYRSMTLDLILGCYLVEQDGAYHAITFDSILGCYLVLEV